MPRTDSNTGYAWTDFVNFDEATSYNGLNRMLSVTGQSTAPQYDGRGNMTRDHQGQTYEYDHYNRLSGVGTSIDLAYDPAGRLQETSGTGITFREMQYDGLDLIAEYDGSGTLTARYVHGPGADEPLVQYAGASVSTRQWLLADERGAFCFVRPRGVAAAGVTGVAVTDWSGAAIQINSYDEYGAPAPGNAGRFGYTGQVWLPETGLYHYKNRAYHPELGRFMQTDPIGVSGGMNLYAYVGGDPVNLVDPLGLAWVKRTINLSVCSTSDGVKTCSRSIGESWSKVYEPRNITMDGGGRWLINPNQVLDLMTPGEDEEEFDCQQGFIDAANFMGSIAEVSGDVGEKLGLLGAGTLAAAPFTGPATPEVAAAGGGLLIASGGFGAFSVFADMGAEGTAGYGNGRWRGTVDAVVDYGLGKLIDQAVRRFNNMVPSSVQAYNLASAVNGYQPSSERNRYSCED